MIIFLCRVSNEHIIQGVIGQYPRVPDNIYRDNSHLIIKVTKPSHLLSTLNISEILILVLWYAATIVLSDITIFIASVAS